MSGGHYDYAYSRLNELADCIERDFINDGKYMDIDWNKKYDFAITAEKEYDRISDASPEERIKILQEIRQLITDLRSCSHRAKELEWYMSSDTGATTYLNRLNKGL